MKLKMLRMKLARLISPIPILPQEAHGRTPEQLRQLANALEDAQRPEDGVGDGVFMPLMTEEEYANYKHEELHGWKPFIDKVLGRETT